MHKKKPSLPQITIFSRERFPKRPQHLARKIQHAAERSFAGVGKIGLPIASNPMYLAWLKKSSMLAHANKLSRRYSGTSMMWQNPYARPRPRSAVKRASVWYTAYPLSLITAPDKTLLESLGSDELWRAFEDIGVRGIHTGPMKVSGGITGWKMTGSVDGYFDRISTSIDPLFGTEEQYKVMADTAARHGAIVIDDIIPGHTGKGADFRLAEMKDSDYPGIYHMIEIAPQDWSLLPDVPKGQDSVNLNHEQEVTLKAHGYIIGKLQRVIFYEKGIKETNWSATHAVRGVDGVARRWVYLHYFKAGQPSLNWLDPSFAGMKLLIGDALHSLGDLGAKGLRLDANGFLGIEVGEKGLPAWSEGHPMSAVANQIIASMIRKLGGFSFQELNLSVDDIKKTGELGADLSYDFVNRPAYHHAITTGDTEFVRMTLRSALSAGVDPASLVHALQNHDELTHELVHYWTVHAEDIHEFRGQKMTGLELRDIIIRELRATLTEKVTYNLPFTENGIACTTASLIAASLGIEDVENLEAAQIEMIKKAHLLLVKFNAWQPGIIALSGWDLAGAMTLAKSEVEDLIGDGDTRWINRGAYDLMNENVTATVSSSGIKRAISLYGSLPEQISDNNSFALGLKQILAVRDRYEIATSHQLDIPDVSHRAMLVMVHILGEGIYQATVLNFSRETITGDVRSEHFPVGAVVTDMTDARRLGTVNESNALMIELGPFEGVSLLIRSQGE